MQILPAPGEPAAGPWRRAPIGDLVQLLRTAAGDHPGRPAVVAVDGRSGSGKSTLAGRLQQAAARAAVVRTDDLAWHHSMFDWADLLAGRVLVPLREGRSVRLRPPGWVTHARAGALEVPAGLDLVLIEGVGAARTEIAPLLDAVVWVQSDYAAAERVGLARDIASGANGDPAAATAFWHGWMAEELPFLDRHRPWERASVVVAGVGASTSDAEQVLLAAPPVR